MSGMSLGVKHGKEFFVIESGKVEHWDATGEMVYNGLLNDAPPSVIDPLLALGVIKPRP